MKDAQEYADKIEAGTRAFVGDLRKASADQGLYRSTTNKYIGGVAGGIAERFGWDATLVRLAFVLTSLSGSLGFWVYLAMWALIPSKESATFSGEFDDLDLPPMPHSGPYVDVPGVDPVETAESAMPKPPVNDPTDEPNTTGEASTSKPPADFPKPDAML